MDLWTYRLLGSMQKTFCNISTIPQPNSASEPIEEAEVPPLRGGGGGGGGSQPSHLDMLEVVQGAGFGPNTREARNLSTSITNGKCCKHGWKGNTKLKVQIKMKIPPRRFSTITNLEIWKHRWKTTRFHSNVTEHFHRFFIAFRLHFVPFSSNVIHCLSFIIT